MTELLTQYAGLPLWMWLLLVVLGALFIWVIPTQRYHQPVVVVWDSTCGFCQRMVGWIERLNWLKLIHLVKSEEVGKAPAEWTNGWHEREGQKGIWVKSVIDDKSYLGFYACRRMAWVMPLFWPMLPLFYVPPLPWIGATIYQWIAKNRHRWSCDTGQCDL